MQTNHSVAWAIALLLILLGSNVSAESEWILRRDQDGIQVYTREIPDSFIDEFKAVGEVEAPMNLVVQLFEDEDRYEEWCYRCLEAKLVGLKNDEDRVIYFRGDMPWPVADRDSYSLHEKIITTSSVEYRIKDYSDQYPETKGVVRADDVRGLWRFTETDSGTVEMFYQQYANPQGSAPPWIVNHFIVENPYHTVKNLREMIEDALKRQN